MDPWKTWVDPRLPMGLASFFELMGVFRLTGIDPAGSGPKGVTEDMGVSSEVTGNIFDPLSVFGTTTGVWLLDTGM